MVTYRWQLIGCKAPTGLAIDVQLHRLFSACDNNKLAVVDTMSGKTKALPTIGSGPDAVAFDKTTQTIITSNGADGTLSLIHEERPNRYAATETVKTMIGARTLAIDPQTQKIYSITAKFGAAPPPTVENPHPRPAIVPGSVMLLVYAPESAEANEK